MSTLERLKEINLKGVIGEILAEKFQGKCNCAAVFDGQHDSSVEFEEETKTPTVEEIKETVDKYFLSLGYTISTSKTYGECFQSTILPNETKIRGIMVVVVTTKYFPWEKSGKKCLRLTTSVHC